MQELRVRNLFVCISSNLEHLDGMSKSGIASVDSSFHPATVASASPVLAIGKGVFIDG